MVQILPQFRKGHKKGKPKNKKDSLVETNDRRQTIRRSAERLSRRLWNAIYDVPRMERVLLSRLRGREAKAVRESEEKRAKRDSQIVALTRTAGYKLMVKWLEGVEAEAYYQMRMPELKKDWQSTDYYVGYYAGILFMIDSLRNVFKEAIRADARRKGKNETT